MIETGTIIDLREGVARVRVEPASVEACKTCGGGCCSGARYEMSLPAPEGLKVGDVVKVEVHPPNPAVSAAILFLAPLVLLLGGAGAWQWLGPRPGGQAVGLLIGVGLMALWYAGVAVCDRKIWSKSRPQPRMIDWSRA